jgi:hypothetical protein
MWGATEGVVPMFRNRAAFDSGLIRFRAAFGSLWNVPPQEFTKPIRFWFDFVPISVRF